MLLLGPDQLHVEYHGGEEAHLEDLQETHLETLQGLVSQLEAFPHWSKDEILLKRSQIPKMYLCGVFLSGLMDIKRVQSLLPKWRKYALKKERQLEILFHPGSALSDEMGEEFNHPDANKFYLSYNRKIEYEAMMKIY